MKRFLDAIMEILEFPFIIVVYCVYVIFGLSVFFALFFGLLKLINFM